MHQYYEEIFEIMSSKSGSLPKWFIVRDDKSVNEGVVYYLKNHNPTTGVTKWIDNRKQAQPFSSEKSARDFVSKYLGNKKIKVIKEV